MCTKVGGASTVSPMRSLRLCVWDGVRVAVGKGYGIGIEAEAVAGSGSVEWVVICSAGGAVRLRHDDGARKSLLDRY